MSRSKPAPEPSRGIKGAIKNKILTSMIKAVDGSFKVLVLDAAATKIISACMRMHDLLDQGVTLVETIGTGARQPVLKSPGIYFVAPTVKNIDDIVKEWSAAPMYQSCHLFFTSKASDAVMQRLQGTAVVPYVKTLKDMNLDFAAVETVVFDLGWGAGRDLAMLFGGMASPARTNLAADQLANVLVALNEKDCYIRHQASPLAEACAARLEETLRRLAPGVTASSGFSEPATVIIVDRSVDAVGPLLHELTYQCLLNDLDPLKDGVYRQTYKDGSGKSCERIFPVDDEDPQWCKFRHLHIAQCMEELGEALTKLRTENPRLAGAESGGASLNDVADAARALPAYQAQLAKLSLHVDLTGKVYKTFNAQGLLPITEIEQNLATGETAEGTKINFKDVLKEVTNKMRDPVVSRQTKTRLLMLLVVTQGAQLTKDKREELLNAAGLGAHESKLIDSLAFLGVAVEKAKSKSVVVPKRPGSTRKDDSKYVASRFEPQCKLVVDGTLRDTLSSTDFPWRRAPPASGAGAQKPAAAAGAKSLRAAAAPPRFQASLGGGRPGDKVLDLGHGRQVSVGGGRVVLFVLGGMTDAEVRGAYELIEEHHREVLIGSTSALTPTGLMEQLPMLA